MMMKALTVLFISLTVLDLAGCLDEENSFDYSQCQETIDFRYRELLPWASASTSGKGASVSIFTDTSNDQYIYSTQYYFICNNNRDTCWYDTSLHRRYRGDTLSFSYDCGMESDCWPVIMCQLDSTHGLSVNTYTLETARTVPINPTLMLDTNSSPATRSPYQIWWPLPCTPWPQAESDAADSLVWADSTGSE